jgi:DNA-binding beta-propeller fold protein YncE
MYRLLILGLAIAFAACSGQSKAADAAPLILETTIPLGAVRGRIDHLAVDPVRKRLFVAELGNDSMAVVDLAAGKLLRRIAGLQEPQGVGYVPSTDAVYVANRRDGSVRVFRGENYEPSGRVDLGEDADNIRVDLTANTMFVGYGTGRIAAIDPVNDKTVAEYLLPAHPEGFQLGRNGEQIFVNLPDKRSIAVIDRAAGQQNASWSLGTARGNFPMALDETNRHVLAVFRNPPRLAAFAMATGEKVAERETCGDSDDAFVDAKRERAYIICGAGVIDVFDTARASYTHVGRVPTVPGARTGLLIPALGRLAVAVRATASERAAVRIYRLTP